MDDVDQQLHVAESQLAAAQARCRELEEAWRVCRGQNSVLQEDLREARAAARYWLEQAEAFRRERDALRAQNAWLKWGVGLLLVAVISRPLMRCKLTR